jgi:hypothetical protein
MKEQFYNPKTRSRSSWSYGMSSTEEKDFNFLEDPIKMTFDMSYGERYPGMQQSGKKPKLYKVEGVGILEEGNWDTAYQAYMNIHELIKLDQEYKNSQNTNPDDNFKQEAQITIDHCLVGNRKDCGRDKHDFFLPFNW